MKKIIILISLLLVCAAILSCAAALSSCGRIRAAIDVSLISQAMEQRDSYEMHSTMRFKYYVDGEAVNLDSESVQIESKGDSSDDYFFYLSSSTSSSSPALNINGEYRSIDVYEDGIYYIFMRDVNGSYNRICGEMDADDFKSYIGKRSLGGIDVTAAKTAKASRQKGGIHIVEFSGFDASDVEYFMRTLGIDPEIFKFNVKDLTLKITCDKEYKILSESYTFEFDVYEHAKNKPSATINVEYSDYDPENTDYTEIKPENYVKLDNIKVLTDVDVKFNALKAASEGSFWISRAAYLNPSPHDKWVVERNDVTYGYKDGKFYYDIDVETPDYKFNVSYSGGKQIVKAGSQKQETAQSEAEAIGLVYGLIDSSFFAIENVTSAASVYAVDATDDVDEAYVIELGDIYPSVYQSIALSYGYSSYESLSHKITVKYYQGELVSIQSEILITLGEWTYITIDTVHKFNK